MMAAARAIRLAALAAGRHRRRDRRHYPVLRHLRAIDRALFALRSRRRRDAAGPERRRTGWAPTSLAAIAVARRSMRRRFRCRWPSSPPASGLVFGTLIGVAAAYFGGLVDLVLMRLHGAPVLLPGDPAGGGADGEPRHLDPECHDRHRHRLHPRLLPPGAGRDRGRPARAICRSGARHRHGPWPHHASRDPAQYRRARCSSRPRWRSPMPCCWSRRCPFSGSARSRRSPPGATCSTPAAVSWRRRRG